MSTLYLLNSPVLTAYGEWSFRGPLTIEEVRQIAREGFVSAIGHAATAEFLTHLLQVPVAAARITIAMQPGDRALVLRLLERLPETAALSTEELLSRRHEIGLLVRVR